MKPLTLGSLILHVAVVIPALVWASEDYTRESVRKECQSYAETSGVSPDEMKDYVDNCMYSYGFGLEEQDMGDGSSQMPYSPDNSDHLDAAAPSSEDRTLDEEAAFR